MKKLYILIFIVLLTFVCLSNHTVIKDGVVIQDNEEVKIIVEYKNRYINEFLGRLNGSIRIINDNTADVLYDYKFRKRHLFKGPLFNFVVVDRLYENNLYELGNAYFDSKINNIVIITNERKIYAATESFISEIEAFRNEKGK